MVVPRFLRSPLLLLALLLGYGTDAGAERYRYEALPVENGAGKELKELTDMEIFSVPRGMTYLARTAGPEATEEINILTDQGGRLISASQRRTRQDGSLIDQTHARLVDNRIILVRDRKERAFRVPGDLSPAMDGSLLILMRRFPFDTDEARQAFMVDFSGQSITVTIRQAGAEAIAVPAGTYDCYRIEAIVNIPLFRPKIVYWISKAPPHFLVKSLGKRGPFTSPYETSLVSVQ